MTSSADVMPTGNGTAPPELDDDVIELFARAIHERYLEHELGKGHAAGSRPGLRPWEELSETLRDASRAQAANFETLIRSRNWALVPIGAAGQNGAADQAGEPFSFTPDEVEELARAEHERWWLHKKWQGYSYGPVRNDRGPDLRHPSMVEWEALTEEDRDRDRDVIRNMPAVLARAGLRIVRLPAVP